ncbi:MAG: TlpA family protein disulfide reductase [Actinomycetota bacterium]
MTRLTCLFVAVLLAVAACSGGDGEAAANRDDPSADQAAAGEPKALDASFTYFDGREGSLADYRGRPLVVNFFASWCVPCVKEMPGFEAVHQALGNEVAFLGLNVRDQLENGREIAAQTGVTYDLARDPDGGFLAAMDGVVMPTTALLDAKGEIVEVHNGALEPDELRDLVRRKLLS